MSPLTALALVLATIAATASAQLTAQEMAMSPNIGDAPPGSPAGCNSPYAVLLNAPNAQIYGSALAQSDLSTAFKYRNHSATILVPTDAAFNNFARQNNLVLGQIDDSILKSIILYHNLFQTVTPADLQRLTTTGMPYQTALQFGANDMVPTTRAMEPTMQLFNQDPMASYQNVTIKNQGAQSTHQFVASGAQNSGNIFTMDPYTPVRTCQGYMYRIDDVLLPTSTLSALSTNPAPAAGAGK